MLRRPEFAAFGNSYLNRYSLGFPPEGPRKSRPWKGGRREPPEAAGSALTFAQECAKQGVRTLYIGSIGHDPEGRQLKRFSRQRNLRSRLVTTRGAQTEIGHHYITTDTDYRIHDGDANKFLTPQVVYDRLSRQRHLLYAYSGGVLKQPELLSELPDLFERIRKLGIKVLLDHGNVPEGFTDQNREHLEAAMPFVDVYFPSMEEATELWTPELTESASSMGRTELAQQVIERIHDTAPSTTVVLKDGSNGIYGAMPGQDLVHAAAIDVPVKHRVGAGDAANAGFAASLLRGGNIEKCLMDANINAAKRISNGGLIDPDIATVQRITESRL